MEWDFASDGLAAVGMMINTGLVWFLVQFIKAKAPQLRESYPQLIPLLGLAVGPTLELLGGALSAYLQHPIDLGPITAAFKEIASGFTPLAGALAVTVDQVGRQWKKRDGA